MFNSLKSKMVVPVIGLLVLIVVFIVVYVSISTARLVDRFEDDRMTAAAQAVTAYLAAHEHITLAVAIAMGSSNELINRINAGIREDIWQYAFDKKIALGVNEIIVANHEGITLARSHMRDSYGDNVSGVPSMAAGLRGEVLTLYTPTPTAYMVMTTAAPIFYGAPTPGSVVVNFVVGSDEFLDRLRDTFDIDATVFAGDRAVASTLIHPETGARAVGTTAAPHVSAAVLDREEHLTIELNVFGMLPYVAYYFPLRGAAGNPIGMFFVGIPRAHAIDITTAQQRNVILIGLGGLAVVAFVMFMYIMKLLKPLNMLTSNLHDIANGDADFTKKLPVIGRDEIAQASTYFNQTMDEFKKLIVSIEGHADALAKKEDVIRERMTAILDSSPLVCSHYDENGNIVEVNKEVENMFGVPDRQVFITNYSKFLPKTQPDGSDSMRKMAEMVAKANREGTARYEWTYLHNDGSPLPTEEIVHRINIGGKDHFIFYSRDLREHYREREQERIVQGKLQAMMKQFNENVEEQSASVTASSAATEEMIANVQSVTDTLSKNTESVRELEEASVDGHRSLNEVVADIQGIARESESLLEINSVMENIAAQTNLLSMNAAIEAARAGESGKGFAVVAGEIRQLAESSSQQSTTIKDVLKNIKESIDKITASTDGVLGKFNAIEAGVKTVAKQEDNILGAMEEQGQGSKQILQAVSNVKDVTHKVKEAARRMVETSKEAMHKTDHTETQAFTDDLTGIRNKEYFMESAERELRYCVDEDRDFNLIMFSVDNLSQILDVHGDDIRDDVLKILAQRTRHGLKQGTLVARYSNEDFVITLPNVKHGTVVKHAELAQKKVNDTPFAVRGMQLDISISVGIASKTHGSKTLAQIVSNAQKALANAKTTGRNRVASFN